MFKEIMNWMFYFKFGSDREAPRIGLILTAVNIGVLFIPELLWRTIGVDVVGRWNDLSEFMKYYLMDMENKNAVYMFWRMLPYTCIVNTVTVAVVFNLTDYQRFLVRRQALLARQKRSREWLLEPLLGGAFLIAIYVWAVFMSRAEFSLAGEFVPTKNRLALLVIYGFTPFVLIPLIVSLCVAEIRAVFSKNTAR